MSTSREWADALPDLLSRLDTCELGSDAAAARAHAARLLADTIGAIMAGTGEPELTSLTAIRGSGARDGMPAASVLAPGLPRLAPGEAALVNGTAAVIMELDEGHRPTGHPAAHIVPAALAVAQAEQLDGARLIEAIILGYEVTARLFAAYRLRHPLHCHGNFGAVGAAVAVARLRGRSCVEPGLIAASLPLLTAWPACLEGATVRNTWSGISAWTGVLANDLAAAGFTGSRLNQPASFGELVGDLVDLEAITAPIALGALQIESNYFKLHSCCASAHSAIDAALSLLPLDAGAIDTIEVATITNNLKIAAMPSDSALSRRFSMPYAIAGAMIRGDCGPETCARNHPAARVLAERVVIVTDPELEALWPQASPARVTVRAGAETRTATVENPRGHWRNPASPEELRAKFARLAWAAEPGTLYDAIVNIEALDDIRTLYDAMTPPSPRSRPR